MPKPAPKPPAASQEQYHALLATIPGLERKGASMPYTSVNGNMFSLLTSDGTLALRLPSPQREEFLKRYKSQLCVQHGTVLKEYVSVPAALFARTTELSKHLAVSYRYACELKAKPTTRKKVAGKARATRARRAR